MFRMNKEVAGALCSSVQVSLSGFWGFPFCIPLVYSLGALCSLFYQYIALYRSKK